MDKSSKIRFLQIWETNLGISFNEHLIRWGILSSFQICIVHIGFYGRFVIFSRFVYRKYQDAKKIGCRHSVPRMANMGINSISLVRKKIWWWLWACWKRIGEVDVAKWKRLKNYKILGGLVRDFHIFGILGQKHLFCDKLS